MDPVVSAALETWSPDVPALALLFFIACLYLRGWLAGRRLVHSSHDYNRLFAFLGGMGTLAIALESPLDALDGIFLSAHMAQHLLLLMIAPPLLLLGQPTLPLLRGLPRRLVKDGLGPFLSWAPLKSLGHLLTAMPVTWLVFALSTVVWHIPVFYELALGAPAWHGVQHACFFWSGILFWWPIILQAPAKRRWPEWTLIPYLLFADIVNTALSAFFIFSGAILYPSYQANHNSVMNAQDDQALAGALMWVPGSIAYLLPAIVFAMRLLKPVQRVVSAQVVRQVRKRNSDLDHPTRSRHLPVLRRIGQVVMLGVAILVVADGFTGSQIAPLNSAGVLPWTYWRALSVIALLTIGNLFCAVCPFMLVRDFTRRLFPARLRWPRMLRNKWLPAMLLLLYFWAYEAFGLWNSPWATSAVIVGYFAAAVVIDGFFRGASFCKYVCPIGQYHFVASLVSPHEVKVKQMAVCQSCRTYDCIRGNAQTRGCELELFQPRKESNLDCTFCMDCVKACPHDNVALLPVLPSETVLGDSHRSSIGRLANRTDYAALLLVVVFGAFVNAAGMIGPVMMFEHRLHARLGPHGMVWAVALFVFLGAAVLPAIVAACCWAWSRDVRLVRRFIFTLAPVGLAMWAAHFFYHLVTVAGGGRLPEWLTPLQLVLLDAGVLWTLYLGWRLAAQQAEWLSSRLKIVAPWSVVAVSLYVAGVWILLQPMDMRGMMH